MKTTVFYDGEKGTARLSMVQETNYDVDIHELTRTFIFENSGFRDAIMDALDLEAYEEADELFEDNDIRQGLLLMVAHEIINNPRRY